MGRVLLVANKTLGSAEISEFVKSRMVDAECKFTLLVPATPSRAKTEPPAWLVAASGFPDAPRPESSAATEDDYEHARSRLEFGLRILRSLGATVDGEVGNPDPAKAIKDIL